MDTNHDDDAATGTPSWYIPPPGKSLGPIHDKPSRKKNRSRKPQPMTDERRQQFREEREAYRAQQEAQREAERKRKPSHSEKMERVFLAMLSRPFEVYSIRKLSELLDADRETLTRMKTIIEAIPDLDLTDPEGEPSHPAILGWAYVRTRYAEQVEGKVSRKVMDGTSTARNKHTKAAAIAREKQKAKAAELKAAETSDKAKELEEELARIRRENTYLKLAQRRAENPDDKPVEVAKARRRVTARDSDSDSDSE